AVIAVVRPVVEVVGGVRVGGLLGGDVGGHLGGGVLGCGGLLDGFAAAAAPPRRRGLARCLLDGGLGPRGRLEQGRGGRENGGERADRLGREACIGDSAGVGSARVGSRVGSRLGSAVGGARTGS